MFRIDVHVPGNWMIRAFGRAAPIADVPLGGGFVRLALMAALALAGLAIIRH